MKKALAAGLLLGTLVPVLAGCAAPDDETWMRIIGIGSTTTTTTDTTTTTTLTARRPTA